jgi:hypothetical protein
MFSLPSAIKAPARLASTAGLSIPSILAGDCLLFPGRSHASSLREMGEDKLLAMVNPMRNS